MAGLTEECQGDFAVETELRICKARTHGQMVT